MKLRNVGGWNWLKQYGLTAALLMAMAMIAVGGISGASEANYAQQLRQTEQSVRRAAVTCYAVEGFYPESLDYLTEHYGIRVDESKFLVDYQSIASNIMPEILIVEVAK